MENRQTMLNRMLNVIKGQAMYLKDDTRIKDEDKLERADILLNIMRYIQNYNEYTQVITEHLRKKQRILEKGRGK